MAHQADRLLAELARDQLQMFTTRQALDLGMSATTLERRRSDGVYESWYRSVHTWAGTPRTFHRQVMAGLFACGDEALASHRTAAPLLGLFGPSYPRLEFLVPYGGIRVPDGPLVHRSRIITDLDRHELGPIRVTSVGRTFADLASVWSPSLLRESVADALRRKYITRAELFDAIDRRGRAPGVEKLRGVLADLDPQVERQDSNRETGLLDLITRAGLPAPVANYQLLDERGSPIAKLDLAYPDSKVSLEYDGFLNHSTPEELASDLARQNRIVLLGWTVLRFSNSALRYEPDKVIWQIAKAIGWPLP